MRVPGSDLDVGWAGTKPNTIVLWQREMFLKCWRELPDSGIISRNYVFLRNKIMDQLDSLDYRLLDLLQEDAGLPVAEMAERLSSSKSVVWRRIQKLEERGVIRGRIAVLDAEKVGLGVTVFAHVKMARHGRSLLTRFVEQVRAYPQVIECHTLMGDVDFLLKIVAATVEDYRLFLWNELSQIDGVQEVSSSISMMQVVETRRLPLASRRGS